MTSTAKQEAEVLMNDLLPLAKRLLAEFGEFHPFGGFISSEGEIVHAGASTGEEFPRGQELVELLESSLRKDARAGKIRCAAVVANVTVRRPGTGDKVDAIEFRLDHSAGYSAHVYFPYKLLDAGPALEPPFATRARAFAFGPDVD